MNWLNKNDIYLDEIGIHRILSKDYFIGNNSGDVYLK